MRLPADIVAYVEETVAGAGLLRAGEALLLAVSGGQDSVAMLLALSRLRERLGLNLTVGHVNHGLRGSESDDDEQFVRELTGTLQLPFLSDRVQVTGSAGSEEAARDARFTALRTMAKESGCDRIALAHTATDRAETVLMNLLRGCGLDGLAAMPAAAGDLVRPLLSLTREETGAYCEARGVRPCDDRTNLDERLLRNRVRLTLLPLLEREYQPGASRALLRLAEIAEAELEWTRPLVRQELGRLADRRGAELRLDLARLQRLGTGLRSRVLRKAVAELRGGVRDVTHEHLQALSVLALNGRVGGRADLPGFWAERTADALVLRPGVRQEAPGFQVGLSVPGEVKAPQAGLAISARLARIEECDPAARGPLAAQLDAAVTGLEFVVRSPKPGDRFAPLGMRGTKKLQDFFADKKIPRAEREGIAVVATTQGEVVWIVGHRISERAKVTERTERVAELVARPLT
jgi:tRNA(Ile)-lysidine synthase